MAIELTEREKDEVEAGYAEGTELTPEPEYEVVEEKALPSAPKTAPKKMETALEVQQLQATIEELKMKLLALTTPKGVPTGAVQVPDTRMASPGAAPAGFVWCFNRGPEVFEWQHDSIHYKIAGHAFGLFPQNVAEHAKKRSLLSLDPVTNRTIHQVVLPTDQSYGVRLGNTKRIELIDRRTSTNPINVPTDVKTHLAVVRVDGVAEAMERREDLFPEI